MRRTAVAIGVLFWISNLATIAGSVITGTLPSAHDALTGMYPHANQWVVGTLVTHINDLAIIGYAVLLFPVLKRYGEGLALGYVAFKALEATMLVVAAAAVLSVIALSQGYLGSGASDSSYQASAQVVLSQQFWAGRLATLSYLVATPILNVMLFQSQLVPRFISIWGLVGVVMLATGLAIGVGDPTRGFQVGQLLVIPILLWELFFATWLIVRGFNRAAVPSSDGLAAETSEPSLSTATRPV